MRAAQREGGQTALPPHCSAVHGHTVWPGRPQPAFAQPRCLCCGCAGATADGLVVQQAEREKKGPDNCQAILRPFWPHSSSHPQSPSPPPHSHPPQQEQASSALQQAGGNVEAAAAVLAFGPDAML